MLILEAARARRAIARTFSDIGYQPDQAAVRAIRMGVKRDLQARRLRPNVPVPSRRDPMKFLRTMHRETGSVTQALLALLHDGSWTSSGGSFRLAERIGTDLPNLCDTALTRNGNLCYLEIGAAWAGLRDDAPSPEAAPCNMAGLAHRYRDRLGEEVFLHMTNLTPWHGKLPKGVVEHPYVTAAGLSALELQGVPPQSVDIIYSQAAAYFETDYPTFLQAAARLLRPGGTLLFNYRPECSGEIDTLLKAHGIVPISRSNLGGMNGAVARFDKLPVTAAKATRAREAKQKVGAAR